jgi:DNA (cytosine-5)-methyltransferase 1
VLMAADLFCGAGGTTCGAEQSGAASVRFAVNHWDIAIQTHSANHPHAVHANRRLDQVHPGEAPRMDLLFASPECIHHSRARGGRPTSDQQRSGAWEVLRWVDHHRPSWIVIENVKEFREWGPVDPATGRPLVSGKGKTFEAWREAIKSYGYRVECFELNAADYGAATSRDRLFVIARKGKRGVPCPEPTHTRTVKGPALPGMSLRPWRSASEVIDWSIPCPSIHERSRPLCEKTVAIAMSTQGPAIMSYYGNSGLTGCDRPLPTITTKDRFALLHGGGRFRMLKNHELAAAQGFPSDYLFRGNKSQVTKQIGNSVSPVVARAITTTIAAV